MAETANILTKTCQYCGATIKYRMVPAQKGQYWLVCPQCNKPLESFSDSQRYEVLEYTTSDGQTVTLVPLSYTKTYTTSTYRYEFLCSLAADPSYVCTVTDPNTGAKLDTVVGYVCSLLKQEPIQGQTPSGGGGQTGGGTTPSPTPQPTPQPTPVSPNLTKYLKYGGIAIAVLLGLLIVVRLFKGGKKKEEKK